ncbi:fused MFS/spermidine synthase [Herbiconiux sp. KACC 21604]|uniref:spermidine synthase n=1 Tax=unclassified Herbiconiux TaxID=2618217 RepID=UPI0014921414|nr:fused MFS/spermidine synthase [Herbiconiux sp. SALV-R1]QJU52308.1 fused MFS/spermidine synthase [Herbiconiux sp. SALV-R1]WPO87156.1 fused MFS/spermidine synthase [Herbiconiux sp. KACC 21604]
MITPRRFRLRPDGPVAELRPDELDPATVELVVDGHPQSHVDPVDPTALRHDYVRRLAGVIDAMPPPGAAPLTVLHLGAGALTLARYLQATRPGSHQHVIELEPALVPFVLEALPLPPGTELRVHPGDAAEHVRQLGTELRGRVDLVIADLYRGTTTPAHVRSADFYASVAELLAPGGLLAVNIADDDGLPALRAQLAVLRPLFPGLAVTGPTSTVADARAGNTIVVASRTALPATLLPALRTAGPHPGTVADADDLAPALTGRTP